MLIEPRGPVFELLKNNWGVRADPGLDVGGGEMPKVPIGTGLERDVPIPSQLEGLGGL